MDRRTLLFLVGCMGTRLALVWLAKHASTGRLRLMGIAALAISFGFLYIWANGLRKTGPETFGAPIWWNDLRPLHATTYAIFAWMALNGSPDAWKVLLFDVSIGFGAWVHHRLKSTAAFEVTK